jgi:1-acyl-sn-glycerol-3-phosphate acyltransferase
MGNFFYYFCRELFLLPLRPCSRFYYKEMGEIPKEGPALILCNHISHADPPYISRGFPHVIHYMADKPLLDIPVLGKMMRWGHVFPIDRTKSDRATIKTTMTRLNAGNFVCIFAEGGIRHGATSVIGGAEMPIGTPALAKLVNVPMIPMIIIGSDQMYSLKKWPSRPRVFVRVGKTIPADKSATKEELRDRITAAWREIFESMKKDYDFQPEELPQSAQQRWGQAELLPDKIPKYFRPVTKDSAPTEK